MGPEFITYKDVATFTFVDSHTGAVGVSSISLPQKNITPSKNILFLKADVFVYGALAVSGELLPNLVFQSQWHFPSPSAPGLEVTGSYASVYWGSKNGVVSDFDVMRSIPAGYSFSYIPGSNSFNVSPPPSAVWFGLVSVTMFYILLN